MRGTMSVLAAVLLGTAGAAYGQTWSPGAGGFVDISSMPGTITLGIPFGGFAIVTTSIGNPAFPAGSIKVGYNATIGSNVGASVSTSAHAPLPTDELYDSKTAMAVIWDTPDPALPTTQTYFREFLTDPNDLHYIVQWTDLPMGGAGGKTTVQTRINGITPFRAEILATLSYQNVHEPGIFGGAFATIGYQSNEPGFNTTPWSFDQPFAVQDGMDLNLIIPSPGAGMLVLAGSLGLVRRRR